MKVAIILIHVAGIVAGLMCAADFSPLADKISGLVCAAANGVGVYLSSVYKTGNPDGGN